LVWGWLGTRYQKRNMLALLYALRALAFLIFLALPLSWVSVLLFSAALGFLWLGTMPLTSGLVAYLFGPTHLSMLLGIVLFSHHLGSFLGGRGPSRLHEITGNYDLMWWIAIGLGLFAAAIHWHIRERPVPRLAIAAASA
jgi:MFS family permease